jgi:bacterioferritin
MQHAADELRHADMVSNRIIQLGGTPVTSPRKWFDLANCKYDEPSDPFVKNILEQNIGGDLATQILQDEVMHEQDLQALQEDLELMLSRRS